jgi:hypothetical protein
VGINGLRGVSAYSKNQDFDSSAEDPRFTDEAYQRATTTTYAELIGDPGRVTERLLGSLLEPHHIELGPYSLPSMLVASRR